MAPLTRSYVHGASRTPLSGETVGCLLRRVAAEGPRPAGAGDASSERALDIRRTPQPLRGPGCGLAQARGLEKGDRVGIWSANVSEWVLAQFGTALAGLILVNINPAYRAHEFEYAMKKSGILWRRRAGRWILGGGGRAARNRQTFSLSGKPPA